MPNGNARTALRLDVRALRLARGTLAWNSRIPSAARAWEELQREADGERHAFLSLAGPDGAAAAREAAAAAAWARGRFEHALLLGIGGSALGARAIDTFVRRKAGRGDLRLHVLDNIDPETVGRTFASLPPRRTLVLVVSKSGGTIETTAQWALARSWLRSALGMRWRDHVLVTTDPRTGALRDEAKRQGLRSLPIPPAVGGRFSVLTSVGMLPAALLGISPSRLLGGARRFLALAQRTRGAANPVAAGAAVLDAAVRARRSTLVLFLYGDRLWDAGDWYRQLLAESLGKGGRGLTPLLSRGATDQHSQLQLYMDGPRDKLAWFWSLGAQPPLRVPREADRPGAPASGHDLGAVLEAERYGTIEGLRRAGRPAWELALARPDPETLGALFLFLECQVAVLGKLWGVDPYDQPGVEAGKLLAKERLRARQGRRP